MAWNLEKVGRLMGMERTLSRSGQTVRQTGEVAASVTRTEQKLLSLNH